MDSVGSIVYSLAHSICLVVACRVDWMPSLPSAEHLRVAVCISCDIWQLAIHPKLLLNMDPAYGPRPDDCANDDDKSRREEMAVQCSKSRWRRTLVLAVDAWFNELSGLLRGRRGPLVYLTAIKRHEGYRGHFTPISSL